MDEEVYHWITIIMLFIIILLVGFKAVQQEQTTGLQFIMEQCLTETPANLTWTGGTYSIKAVNNACYIQETTS